MSVTLGRTTGTTAASLTANNKAAYKVTLGSGATFGAGTITFSSSQSLDTTAKTRLVVYSDTAGAPDVLLGESNDVYGLASSGAYIYYFASPLVLSAGDYWLGCISSVTASMLTVSTGGSSKTNADTYAGGAANPFGAGTTGTKEYVISLTERDAGVSVAKANAYAVTGLASGVSVAKALAYAVIDTSGVDPGGPARPIVIAVM